MRFDTIWLDARLATLAPGRPGHGIIERGAVAAKDGRIALAAPMAELPTGWDAINRIALDGRLVTPGLVDCHTHLVYAGDRAQEFELRLCGASYEEIARAGGGIASTVKATRSASEDDLVAVTLPRLDRLLAEGVTTIEIKSGYGLDLETEVRMLRAGRRLAWKRDVGIVTSFLAAHVLRRACFAPRGQQGCRSSSTPTNSATCTAPNSQPTSGRCPPTISNTPMKTASLRWRAQVLLRCCFPALSMF